MCHQCAGCVLVSLRFGKRILGTMIGLIIFLLVLWLALSILGFVVKGLIWLAVIGLVLFVITAIVGYFRRGARSK